MELYYTFSILIVLASFFAYLNLRFLKLPGTIGIMIIAMLVSVGIRLLGDSYFPATTKHFFALIKEFDFNEILMGAMLNFLLFAGALHVNMSDLKEQKVPIIIYSTVSVVLSALIISVLFYYIAPVFGIKIPYIFCLVFGTLISPTDPIVVLGVLKQAKVPKRIETKIVGESLFNDGVAVVMFAVVLKMATDPTFDMSFSSIAWLFAKEGIGGLLLGAVLGFTASRVIKKIDDYKVSVLITLSIVMGGFLIAQSLHVSSPLAMVVAGLIIGNYGKKVAMSDETKDYLEKFWELIDEILNAILFLFIGFELLLLPDLNKQLVIGFVAIFIVLFSRIASIVLPWKFFDIFKFFGIKSAYNKGSLMVLVWGGIRGGVSIALVLSMPEGEYKNLLLEVTYIVVLFSIVVQGLTVGKLAKKVLEKE
ncbi:cation:proton antiporter [Flavobacterium hibernum]|uniref:Sodium:proton antiporter n=1 Tax=Flavobacterium hibernum TaxID=37752 RepID=A0A0D0EMW4_9FLAO|nr:sodium:proton antiporter [Flavobacterium hibernum]KIO54100.1 sodium:proton antiporter [Flavobacterium hibernum]OXA89795.1 sodium:proton antiporter [Flavobacterium hibernum]STO13981.1 Sodium, potassium, lithium and rubidium/H(+) antiporter [Flavobacterium hibernum]